MFQLNRDFESAGGPRPCVIDEEQARMTKAGLWASIFDMPWR